MTLCLLRGLPDDVRWQGADRAETQAEKEWERSRMAINGLAKVYQFVKIQELT